MKNLQKGFTIPLLISAVAIVFLLAMSAFSKPAVQPVDTSSFATKSYVDKVITEKEPKLGSATPVTPAVFETSLASGIGSSDTSMTVVSGSLRGGAALSGYICPTIDEGTTVAEYVCGTISGTSITGLTRGIEPLTGTTSLSALKFAHRRGADVKITDYPTLGILSRQSQGIDGFNQAITYDSTVASSTFTSPYHIVDKDYVDGLAFATGGLVDATTAARGVSVLATTLQGASSTATLSSHPLVLPASSATSTYNSATAPLRVVVTQNNGKIDSNFISTSTLLGIIPAGSISAYSSTTAPNGWLLTDGTSYATSTYPNLFSVIGYSYGGSGANYNVPNLLGRTVLMASTTANIGQTGGESNHTITQAQIPSYTLGITIGSNGGGGSSFIQSASSYTTSQVSNVVSSGGSGQAMNVLPPYIVLQYIIKY